MSKQDSNQKKALANVQIKLPLGLVRSRWYRRRAALPQGSRPGSRSQSRSRAHAMRNETKRNETPAGFWVELMHSCLVYGCPEPVLVKFHRVLQSRKWWKTQGAALRTCPGWTLSCCDMTATSDGVLIVAPNPTRIALSQ